MRRDILEELELADFWPQRAVAATAPATATPAAQTPAAAHRSTSVAQTAASQTAAAQTPAAQTPAAVIPIENLGWDALAAAVRLCQKCDLHRERTNAVFGAGAADAHWMFVGEGPGADEDAQGLPFVGRAGKLLNEMLTALGLPRERVYIANVVKCRPPGNREPRPAEMLACRPYLERQIALLAPKIIVALGRIAASHLLQSAEPIGKMRQRLFDFCGLPLVVTYHPAYLLRSPGEKRKSWEDLCFARRILRGDN